MKRVFISFKAEDRDKVQGLRLLAKNTDFDLDFYDESVKIAINSKDADYIKSKIREKISRAGVILCIISEDTYKSDWVNWELNEAIENAKPIVAMAVKGIGRATLPSSINDKVKFYSWDPSNLGGFLDDARIIKN